MDGLLVHGMQKGRTGIYFLCVISISLSGRDECMNYIYDSPFCDVFRCDGELDFHDYYYVSPYLTDESSYLYHVHRAGLESSLPALLEVERGASTKYCEIFCILSGYGYLEYGGKKYDLHRNQLVLLPAHTPHKYGSDPVNPMGTLWLEIYGADSNRIIRHLIDLNGPVLTGALYPEICAQICMIQQRLMVNAFTPLSLEVYQLLLTMLQNHELPALSHSQQGERANFQLVEAYINAHMSRKITNAELADVCGISLQYFMKRFRERYQLPPQEFIMRQRIKKAQYSLLHTALSVEAISETLGFCDSSHFIRRFTDICGVSPTRFRKVAQEQRENR